MPLSFISSIHIYSFKIYIFQSPLSLSGKYFKFLKEDLLLIHGNPCHNMWHLFRVTVKGSWRASIFTFLRLWYLLLSWYPTVKAMVRLEQIWQLLIFWFGNFYLNGLEIIYISNHIPPKTIKNICFQGSYHYVVWPLLRWWMLQGI